MTEPATTQLSLWKNEKKLPHADLRDAPLFSAAGRLLAERHHGLHLVTPESMQHYRRSERESRPAMERIVRSLVNGAYRLSRLGLRLRQNLRV